jgi:phosphonoacetaldehyde hydrolase
MRGNRLKAVVLDWSGTVVDHGSVAPVIAMQSLFARHGIHLSSETIRRDMGLLKRDHIRSLLAMPEIAAAWQRNEGRAPDGGETQRLFDEFVPLQLESIETHSALISGAAETVAAWQDAGLRIGSTTGYTRAMLAPVLELSARSGYRPDAAVCPDDVGAGRPFPWMAFRNLQLLSVFPPSCCVKIGDTASDIEEGKNAGMWTIGLLRTGNLIGLNESEWHALTAERKSACLEHARLAMTHAGADYLAESLADCEAILRKIDDLL